ncbi:uncharacterized protein TNCV_1432341 [Trichonephila clavipes]|nr:uncharacterized protein TNCV_1432341 [Trichonephila clavipes]
MKALKFYKELKESEPSTSSRESEVSSADEEAARKYPEKLAKIIKDGEYCAHQVFNADETGLFWKKMPTRGEGFDDFGEHDIEELLVDEALNDDDILESMVDITKDLETVDSEPEEDVTPLDEKLLREGLQLSAERRFVEWAQNEIAVVPDFHKRILFSDEAHLWLNGYVNKQNCRIWSEADPQVYVETPLHPEKLTVWCA